MSNNVKLCKKVNCINATIPRGKYCEYHRTIKKQCIEIGCTNSSQGKTDKCKAHGGGARCIEIGCTTSAIGSTQKCKIHGGGKRCTEIDCNTSAAEKSNKCKAHGGGKRCLETGCRKSAQGTTNKCKAHGGGARCTEAGCTSSARSAGGASDKCAAHGGGVRCNEVGCTNSAQGATNKCKAHGGGARCTETGCTSSAVDASNKCKTHGGGARCTEAGCTTSARESSDKCMAHGGGARCPHCIDWIDSRSGSKKYDGYCATCFKRIFPEDPRSTIIYEHSKEIQVRNAIAKHFTGFIHDIPLYTGGCDCTHRRRIDHRTLIGNTILAVETDEFAHSGYDEKDEEIRYDDVYMIHSGKWIWIRFNPDKTRSCTIDIEDRLITLIYEIEKQIQRIEVEDNKDLVEIIKLFY